MKMELEPVACSVMLPIGPFLFSYLLLFLLNWLCTASLDWNALHLTSKINAYCMSKEKLNFYCCFSLIHSMPLAGMW